MPIGNRREFLAELRRLKFDDPEDQASLEELYAVLNESPDPFSRKSFPCHVTASGLLLDVRGERLATVWHAKSGRYFEPGGHCEPGDVTVLDAMWRELEEETGVTWQQAMLLCVYPVHVEKHPISPHGDEPAHIHYDVRYALKLREEFNPPGVYWVALDAISEPGLRRAASLARQWVFR